MEETLWQERDKTYNIYNIYAEKVVLLDVMIENMLLKVWGNLIYGTETKKKIGK